MLDYRASYTHRGKYYILNEVADYDENGLWWYEQKGFSAFGTLTDTLTELVRSSNDGRFARELRAMTNVAVQDALIALYKAKVLCRVSLGGQYLYVWPKLKRMQQQRRRACRGAYDGDLAEDPEAWEQFCAGMLALLSVSNEKQRRLYLGLESIRLGPGADKRVAAVAGVDPRTVAAGRKELLSHDVSMERIRAAGAGRPALKKN